MDRVTSIGTRDGGSHRPRAVPRQHPFDVACLAMRIFKKAGGESWSSGQLFIFSGLLWAIGSLFGNVGLYVPIAMMFIVIGLGMLQQENNETDEGDG